MDCNDAGVNLIKQFETCDLLAYPDANGFSIGWGHHGDDVTVDMQWTQDQADAQFDVDLSQRAEIPVSSYVCVPLTSNQFSALCSLCYNIGSGNFQNSTLLKMLNQRNYLAIPDQFMRWVYDGGIVSADLVERRTAEVNLWNTPNQNS